ncbi:agmatine deiminase family protein [Legionella jordanis]|uniref:Putative agmatine deiminase n=1 Tax=Legionella jordanis TaxID=456 RepID=A0A0W0V963_9GAMM|nr:agmatine deiminase family protein [Legionella jordanis]KTD16675.1 peptidylarginine deiminase [Legionella jordanis]RMX03792.1 agmatine deiminase family protein [Legionella jordanis]RMX22147.1 agmatine deiminase family protein [Legionella jordanis]VEH11857.1 peptidylarginine deiminase [Legionella jordanis]
MTTAQKNNFRMPPEWHPHAACWMAWPCHQETWKHIGMQRAREAYALVAKTIAQYEPVKMLVNPEDETSARELCGQGIELIPLSINDSWTRDTGPSFLINDQQELAGVDWIHNAWGGNYSDYALDNEIAAAIIQRAGASHFKAPLVMEGGSFHVDGEGSILTTRECLLNPNRNPHLSQSKIEDYLCNYLNAKKVIWLNQGLVGDETDGHIDEIACFVGPAKVLALITHDKQDVNYARLHENLNILKTSKDAKGRPLEVITVEQPPATYLDGERLTLSYINFYMANKGIVMPAFGYPEYDKAAYELFSRLFPDYGISQINALDVFAGGGGIHCITQQQPLAG